MDLGETVPSVCSETVLTVCVDGSEVGNMRAEEVLYMQKEEDFEHSLCSGNTCTLSVQNVACTDI
jgi:hypothetical protein